MYARYGEAMNVLTNKDVQVLDEKGKEESRKRDCMQESILLEGFGIGRKYLFVCTKRRSEGRCVCESCGGDWTISGELMMAGGREVLVSNVMMMAR